LSEYDQFFSIAKEKKNQEYKLYLEELFNYLYNYLLRVKPLIDINKELQQVSEEFEKKWLEGTFPGWPKETSGALMKSGAYLDLSSYTSWEELASLGLDRLKLALMALGLKCGGSLEERAIRLFQTKGKKLEELDPSLFSKANKVSKKEYTNKHKEIAEFEAQCYCLSEILSSHRANTIENVQRKQARTGDEREEDEEDFVKNDDSDEDEEGAIYNPKNLPLGWDGKVNIFGLFDYLMCLNYLKNYSYQ
jgi:splicing factor 3A subunit 3